MTRPNLIGSREVTDRLGINGATLSRMVEDGRIAEAFKAPGKNGARFFDPAEVRRVERVFKRQREASTPAA